MIFSFVAAASIACVSKQRVEDIFCIKCISPKWTSYERTHSICFWNVTMMNELLFIMLSTFYYRC